MSFKLKFWGVRGSIAVPGRQHAYFGGNTSCLEVSAGGEHFILDGGTGIRNLGHWLLRKDVRRATILVSHTHWDHINGLPFFSPAFRKECSFHIMAGHDAALGGIANVLSGQMQNHYSPVPVEAMQSALTFEDFKAGETLKFGPNGKVVVRTAPLNHPNGATGYRFEYGGRALCYVTDTEHKPGKPNSNVLSLIESADLVVYDSTYSDEEFDSKVGWGHSTWQEGIRLAQTAEVGNLAIFHHDPDHDDTFMKQVAVKARRVWPGAFVAREGMRIDVEALETNHRKRATG